MNDFFVAVEDKRSTYDVYGKAGLSADGQSSSSESYQADPRQRFAHSSSAHSSTFHFRDPQEVFMEFFGGRDPFAQFFSDVGELPLVFLLFLKSR